MIKVSQSTSLVIIDPNLDNHESLAAGIIPGSHILILDHDRHPIDQITTAIESAPNPIFSLHLVAHGLPGQINLGETPLNLATIDSYPQIHKWQVRQICLYTCHLAANHGQKFLKRLHEITGAAIAASVQAVGNPRKGGTWTLDHHLGEVISSVPFSPQLQQTYPGIFATFTVTNSDDFGPGSLRQAILDSNNTLESEPNRIVFDLFILDQGFDFGTDTYTISPESALTPITNPVIIDGTTQGGFRGTPIIQLDGSIAGAASGLTVTGGNTTITGLAINGFSQFGIELIGEGNNTIVGNYIGIDSLGTTALGNGFGISISNSANNIIGSPENPNVISGQNFSAIVIDGVNATNNQIQGNIIGSDIRGNLDLGNGRWGILINADNNAIANNTIAFNRRDGIAVETGTGNTITNNTIINNNGLGIDLGRDGITLNDPQDIDTGPNSQQNFPILSGAFSDETTTTITGNLNSTPNSTFTLQFFSHTQATRQGRDLIGETSVTTDDNGDTSFVLNLPIALGIGDFVTATATNTQGDTSEFSGAIAAQPPATINFTRASYRVNEDGTPDGAEITLDRGGDISAASVITLRLQDGTATGATPPLNPNSGIQDFDNTPQTIIFQPGESRVNLTIPINDDTVVEENETFELVLDSLAGGNINALVGSQGTATVTIIDNEVLPGVLEISHREFRVTEGTPAALITINRIEGDQGSVSATLNLRDGTATSPEDYTNISPVIVQLADGQTSQTVRVPITDDDIPEATETVDISLSNPTGGARLGRSNATLIIEDDDNTAGLITFDQVEYTVTEGTPSVTATVLRRDGSAGAVSVVFLAANGTATAPQDFINNTPIELEFADGQTRRTVSIPIVDDDIFEETETFNLFLDSISGGASYGETRRAIVTIFDDDDPPGNLEFEQVEYTVTEGTPHVEITVVRVNGSAGEISADLLIRDGTAKAPQDYTNISPRTLRFADGQTRQIVRIPIIDDDIREDPETFTVSLLNPSQGTRLGQKRTATVTIEDNDNPPGTLAFEQAEYNVTEGVPFATITISRSEGDLGEVSAELIITDGTATAPEDYQNTSPVTVEFADGQVSQTVNIPIVDDDIIENDETVNFLLDNATGGAVIGQQSTAILVIEDNDNPVGTIQFAEAKFEVDEDTPNAVITLIRSGGSQGVLRANVNLADNTATSPDDYINNSPILVEFADGQLVQTFTIPIVDDDILEDDEIVDMMLESPDGDVFFGRQKTAQLIIIDDEVPPNNPPTITDISDQTLFQNIPAPPIIFSVEDVETPATELVVTASSDNPELIPIEGIILSGESANRNLLIIPAADQSGEALITMTVSDGEDTVSDEFLVTVSPQADLVVNFAPGSPLVTSESGSTVELIVFLENAPTDDVIITVETSDPTEGIPSPTELIFTPDNWDTAQTVVVTGQPDQEPDGDRPYTINLVSSSLDLSYHEINRAIALTNLDVPVAIIPEPLEVDTLIGGEGSDVFLLRNHGDQFAPLSPSVSQFGTPNSDSLEGSDGNDVILARGGNDTILGFGEDDFLDGQGGDDLILGGQGNDILIGNPGDDTLFGEKGSDVLYGGPGGDILYGNEENDTIYGDQDDDTIYGGQGNDSLVAGTGSDLLLGDKGDDTLMGISGRVPGYTLIDDFDIDEDIIQLTGFRETFRLEPSPEQLPPGTAIVRQNRQGDFEIIAVVKDVSGLDLEDNYFRFS